VNYFFCCSSTADNRDGVQTGLCQSGSRPVIQELADLGIGLMSPTLWLGHRPAH